MTRTRSLKHYQKHNNESNEGKTEAESNTNAGNKWKRGNMQKTTNPNEY